MSFRYIGCRTKRSERSRTHLIKTQNRLDNETNNYSVSIDKICQNMYKGNPGNNKKHTDGWVLLG